MNINIESKYEIDTQTKAFILKSKYWYLNKQTKVGYENGKSSIQEASLIVLTLDP